MKTYILINTLGGGGAERQVSYISRLNGIEKILCIEPILKYEIPDDRIIYLSKRIANGSILVKCIQLVEVLWNFNKLNIDKNSHLICFLQFSNILGIVAKIFFGCKTTLSIRINPFLHASSGSGISLSGKILGFLLKKADAIVPNSYDTANDIKKHYPQVKEKVFTICNGYDIEDIQVKSERELGQYQKLFDQFYCLLTVGRLNKQKGQWHLLKLMPELKKSNEKVKLIIMGEGELEDALKAMCKNLEIKYYCFKEHTQLNTNADVFFIGFQKNPYPFYKGARLFLFPSLYEGLPNALIEAIICNARVISANCKSGPFEIMTGNTNSYDNIQDPVYSNYGVLLPAFDDIMDLNSSNFNSLEVSWLETIITEMNSQETNQFSNKDITQYSLENAHSEWRKFIKESAFL